MSLKVTANSIVLSSENLYFVLATAIPKEICPTW